MHSLMPGSYCEDSAIPAPSAFDGVSIRGLLRSFFVATASSISSHTPPAPTTTLPGSFPETPRRSALRMSSASFTERSVVVTPSRAIGPLNRRVRQPAKTANRTDFHRIGGHGHRVILAGECGHKIHPAHTYTYVNNRCPKCEMSVLIEDLTEKIAVVEWWPHGAYYRQNKVAGRNENDWEENDKEPFRLFRNDVSGPRGDPTKKKKKGKRQGGWRTAKKRLVNFVQASREMVQQEQAWAEKHPVEVTTEKWLKTFAQYTACAALQAYDAEEEKLARIEGDPAPCILPDSTSLKRKRGAEEDGQPPKRRNVVFSRDIWVSEGIDDIDDSTRRRHLVKRSNCLKEAVPNRTSTGPFWRQRGMSRSPTGVWRSPEGYEKANTSWFHEEYEQMQMDSAGQ